MPRRETLEAAVRRSLKAADHLGDADAAAVAAALALARRLDAGDVVSTTWPTFLRALNACGLTPEGRDRLSLPARVEGGKLAEMRALHVKRVG